MESSTILYTLLEVVKYSLVFLLGAFISIDIVKKQIQKNKARIRFKIGPVEQKKIKGEK